VGGGGGTFDYNYFGTGNRMLVGQAEYRRELFWRVGAVAFAGAGAVAPTSAEFGNTDPEPGGGFGLRFVLAKRNHINLRTDFARGANLGPPMSALGRRFEAPDYGRPSHEYCQAAETLW